jgi:hypothetical protein
MTSFYKCSCGYTTKNEEYANFHRNNDGCKAVKYESAFDGNGGLIAMIKKHNMTKFIKWYDTKKNLMSVHPDAKFRYSCDCDREFVKMITKSVHEGIIATYDTSFPMVRNDSAERLFYSF